MHITASSGDTQFNLQFDILRKSGNDMIWIKYCKIIGSLSNISSYKVTGPFFNQGKNPSTLFNLLKSHLLQVQNDFVHIFFDAFNIGVFVIYSIDRKST